MKITACFIDSDTEPVDIEITVKDGLIGNIAPRAAILLNIIDGCFDAGDDEKAELYLDVLHPWNMKISDWVYERLLDWGYDVSTVDALEVDKKNKNDINALVFLKD